MKLDSSKPKVWLTSVLLVSLSLPVLAAPPQGAALAAPTHSHRAQSAAERAPWKSDTDHLRQPLHLKSPVTTRAASAATLAACDVAAFTGNSGAALVSAVRASSVDCINTLFSLTGSDAQKAFKESQMVSIANALQADGQGYAGDNRSSTAQLVLFLRAGYYVQYYNSSTVGNYGSALVTAIRGALDAFFGNSASRTVSAANGDILSEVVTLIDSSSQNARYLATVRTLLASYSASWDAYSGMKNAVNNTFTVMYRGHQLSDFQLAVQNDASMASSLADFANRHWAKLGTGTGYLVVNATRELARFVQYAGTRSTVRPLVKAQVDRSSVTGVTAPVWMTMGDMTDYYDAGQCSYYQLCNWKAQAEAAVLPLRQVCSSTLTLRAQSMSSTELNQVCSSVLGEEGEFHTRYQTNRVPVANDNNTSLELVVFNSSSDYQTYAGPLYGIDTNNGGMYLEGNPSAISNQARFIAYEAEWKLPAFEVWNLNHEYAHYLDGRFNMYGDFAAATSVPNVWWIEGQAEYMSYCYRKVRYDDAMGQAALRTYTLNQLFDTDYSGGTTRIYNWGYLAVAFMMERHRSDISSLLGYFRKGDWQGARSLLKTTIGSRYDSEFGSWLASVPTVGVNCSGATPVNQAPKAAFSYSASGLSVSFADQSSDPDGSIASRLWTFHDGSTSTAVNPSKTYGAAGSYTVRLDVKDNGGLGASSSQTITVAAASTCPSRTDQMANGCTRTGLGGAAGDLKYFFIYVDKPGATLTVRTVGGTGNADLYVNTSTWASPGNYTQRAIGSSNAETLSVNVPTPGYVYLSVSAKAGYSGVSLSTSY